MSDVADFTPLLFNHSLMFVAVGSVPFAPKLFDRGTIWSTITLRSIKNTKSLVRKKGIDKCNGISLSTNSFFISFNTCAVFFPARKTLIVNVAILKRSVNYHDAPSLHWVCQGSTADDRWPHASSQEWREPGME
jgi:hypothetical protein